MSHCKYQKCVQMKVLDNSFSRIIHLSGEILKFTLCTGTYSTVNKIFLFLFSIKKKVMPTEGTDIWCLKSLAVDFWVLANSHIW